MLTRNQIFWHPASGTVRGKCLLFIVSANWSVVSSYGSPSSLKQQSLRHNPGSSFSASTTGCTQPPLPYPSTAQPSRPVTDGSGAGRQRSLCAQQALAAWMPGGRVSQKTEEFPYGSGKQPAGGRWRQTLQEPARPPAQSTLGSLQQCQEAQGS